MTSAPPTHAEVPQLAADRGVPGFIDIHTHFMSASVLRKVQAWFDSVRLPNGDPGWPSTYRGSDHERVELLRSVGVNECAHGSECLVG